MGKGKKQKSPPKKDKEDSVERKRLEEEEQAGEEDELEFQKAVLEIRVKELEQLKIGMQRKCEYLETQADLYKTQLEEMKEEKDDIIAHLNRTNSESKAAIKELEGRLFGTQKTREDEATDFLQRIALRDKDRQDYEEKMDKIVLELNAKLATLEDFRVQRETLLEEKETLKNTLEAERKSFQVSYDNLENKTIVCKDRLRRDAIEMLVQMSQDVHKAGKLCLTATVKSAINSNVKLQNELEITSKDNIALRKKIEKLSDLLREKRMTIEVIEDENTMTQQKCLEYKDITIKLINRQLELEAELKETKYYQKELRKLETTHSYCKTDDEVKQVVAQEIERLLEKQRFKEMQNERLSPEEVQELQEELVKFQDIVVKLAVTAKHLAQAGSAEEQNFLKDELKVLLMKTYEMAMSISNLPSEVKEMLTMRFPDVTKAVGTIQDV